MIAWISKPSLVNVSLLDIYYYDKEYLNTTSSNTIPIDDIISYGDILELYGVIKAFLITDKHALRFFKSTCRKEGREASKRG